uniref:Tubulin--tyrosine ligase-like protein 9 n=1 Tax=Macrostomum lignano TaxID=282301 RepID=A0A1I8J0L8_9PLAT
MRNSQVHQFVQRPNSSASSVKLYRILATANRRPSSRLQPFHFPVPSEPQYFDYLEEVTKVFNSQWIWQPSSDCFRTSEKRQQLLHRVYQQEKQPQPHQQCQTGFMSAVPSATKQQARETEEEKNASATAPVGPKKRADGDAKASKKSDPKQSVYLAQGHNGQALVEAAMSRLGWTKTTDKTSDDWKLSWTETKGMVNYGNFREGRQLVNHIPNCELICNKLGLLTSLREFERVSVSMSSRQLSMQMTDFFPETYVLDYPREREAFFEAFKPGEIWINKPTGLNQGKGIFLIRDLAKFREELQQKDEQKPSAGNQAKAGKSMGRIVQRYIMNPLLIHGRKFDVRAYMLIGSTAPYLVLFHHGYLRLSIHKYDTDDSNLCTHLTNQYIQKKDEKYEEVKNDTVWSMAQLNDYLNSLLESENKEAEDGKRAPPPPEKDWVFNGMEKHMKSILLHMFSAVKHKLTARLGYFELYGIDFMIDDNYKLFLIEVNTNPAMHVNCQLLKDLLPPLIDRTIHIALDCFDKSKKGLQLLPLKSLGSFQVLHCGATAPRSQSRSSPSKLPLHGGGSPQAPLIAASSKRQQALHASPTLRRQAASPNVLPTAASTKQKQQGGLSSAQAQRENSVQQNRAGSQRRQPLQAQQAKPDVLLSYEPAKTPARRESSQVSQSRTEATRAAAPYRGKLKRSVGSGQALSRPLAAQSPALTDDQMDMFVRPCVVDNINCPPGNSVAYSDIRENLPMMKLALMMQTGSVPADCEEDCEDNERCNRLCYYAIMKVAVRMDQQQSRGSDGDGRDRRGGRRSRGGKSNNSRRKRWGLRRKALVEQRITKWIWQPSSDCFRTSEKRQQLLHRVYQQEKQPQPHQQCQTGFMSAVPSATKQQARETEEEKNASATAPVGPKKRADGDAKASKKSDPKQSVYLAQGHNGQALVEAAMSRLGWTKTTDKTSDDWKLSWTETKGMVNYGNFREGRQLVNHIPNCELICNKLGLLTSLREFERVSVSMSSRQLSMQMTDFFPETYVLDYPREREAFFEAFKPGEIWINKPTGLNQGKGIFLIRDLAKFREELQQKDEQKPSAGNQAKAGKSMGRIVQRYIMNPLLIHGRKFDVRAYMLIGSTAPYLVLFHHGYLRLSIHKYDTDDSNLCTHLTNQYIQKKDEKYEEVKND